MNRMETLWSVLGALAILTTGNTFAAHHEHGAEGSLAASRITDIITTSVGKVQGSSSDVQRTVVRIFKGIPYGAPPVGDLRWKAPRPPAAWEGVRNATQWASRCPQRTSLIGTGGMSEDCLHLNVSTPAKSTADRLPVMVFFHGGGLTIGSANSDTYNHDGLPRHGIVLVTVNSRLGPIGYMAHPALTRESEHGASGNYGTLDLIASLEWVQANIEAFGGDPDNVLIFGESGGGTKTLSVMSSPLSAGLFHKAIVQSGSGLVAPGRSTTLENAEERGERIAAKLGLQDEDDVLAALRSASWEDLIVAASDREVGFRTNVTVDGWVLPESVDTTFVQGEQYGVPLIVGANAGERSLRTSVPMLGNVHSATGSSSTYLYSFSHVPTGWRNEPCVAFHGIEIPYVFGYIPEGLLSPTILFLSRGGGCTSDDPGTDGLDDEVAEWTLQMWAQFARTGDPSVQGLIEWPAYTEDNGTFLDIGGSLEVKTGIENSYVQPPGRDG